MSMYSKERAIFERKRRARAKRGSEELGSILGLAMIVALPFWWAVKYSLLLVWYMLKGLFWLFFWPIKLFKK